MSSGVKISARACWRSSTTSSTSPRSRPASSSSRSVDFDLGLVVEDVAALLARRGARQGHRVPGPTHARGATALRGDPDAPAAGPAQPRLQRGEVHRPRARSCCASASVEETDDAGVRSLRGDATPASASTRRTRAAVRALHPGRLVDHAALRRAPASAWRSSSNWSS